MKYTSLVRFFLLLSTCWVTVAVTGRAPLCEESPAGQTLVAERCVSCHSFEAVGYRDPLELARSQAPGLAFAGSKFQQSWLEKWLVSPTRIRPAGYLPFRHVVSTPSGDQINEAAIPDHPALRPADAKAVAGYLASLKKEVNPYPTSASPPSIRAQVHFEKIAGCAACHQARQGHGGLSGPELYTAFYRLDREWAASFINDPRYWSLNPMPKLSMRADQLLAITDYVFQPQAESPSIASLAKPKVAAAQESARPLPGGRAETIYQVFCSQCHGIQGNGKGINAAQMFVSPRNHTSFGEMSMLTDDRLFAVIKFGGPAVGKSVLMPSWGGMIKDSDISILVEYLRALSGTRAGIDRRSHAAN